MRLPCCTKHRCARQCFQRRSGRRNPPRRRGGAPDAASCRADRPERGGTDCGRAMGEERGERWGEGGGRGRVQEFVEEVKEKKETRKDLRGCSISRRKKVEKETGMEERHKGTAVR